MPTPNLGGNQVLLRPIVHGKKSTLRNIFIITMDSNLVWGRNRTPEFLYSIPINMQFTSKIIRAT